MSLMKYTLAGMVLSVGMLSIHGFNVDMELTQLKLDTARLSQRLNESRLLPEEIYKDRIVKIHGFRSYGTGFYLNHKGKQYLVTAGHVCANNPPFAIKRPDGKEEGAFQFRQSEKYDLCVIKAEPGIKSFELAVNSMRRYATSVGHGRGADLFSREGSVIGGEANLVLLSYRVVPGMSGGPVINSDGKVIGVTVAIDEFSSYAEGVKGLTEFLDSLSD